MLPVIELFTSIQGEGKYSGVPSHFIRVSGCNLRCVFKDSVCDTPYSSFDPEKSLWKDMDSLVAAFKTQQEKYPHVKHLVITGGEPLLYKKDLEEFLGLVYDDEMVVTIETNGTLPILNPLGKNYRIALYSVSPKLSTSVGVPGTVAGYKYTEEMRDRHEKTRMNYKNLVDIVMSSSDYQFKFVYSGPECEAEIVRILKEMGEIVKKENDQSYNFYKRHHPGKHIMIMPEGIKSSQLDNKSREIADICIKRGWTYTDRLHIRIWDNKRGV